MKITELRKLLDKAEAAGMLEVAIETGSVGVYLAEHIYCDTTKERLERVEDIYSSNKIVQDKFKSLQEYIQACDLQKFKQNTLILRSI